jgi:hypothetical protein
VSTCRTHGLRNALVAWAGVDPLSHKKKANFWRDLAEAFPQLIDFLCSPADLGQVVLSHSPHTCRACCLIRLLWKGALVSGLDLFYGAYIASRGDTTDLEDDDGAINTSWWSCIRPKFRGAVSPIFPRSSHVGNEDRSRRQAIERTRSDWWSCVSGFVFPRQHKRRKQKALPRGTRTPTHPMGRDRASPGL